MAKILIFSSHILWESHYETELEIIQRHIDKGDEVIHISCNAELNFCEINRENSIEKCFKCINKRFNGYYLLNEKIKILPYLNLNSRDKKAIKNHTLYVSTIEDLKKIKVEKFDIGYAVASSIISYLKDPNPNLELNRELLIEYFNLALTTYYSIKNHINNIGPDVFYVFNGRLAQTKAAFCAARFLNINCFLHERGSTFKQYELYENHLPHDLAKMAIKIKYFWEENAEEQEKINKAAYFFENRRKGNILSWKSFTDKQEKGSLPIGFDPNKKNVVIFNSSEFEFASVGPEWNNPLYKNQNEGIQKIVSDMAVHSDYHFYLRLHPNLATADPVNFEAIKKVNLPNLSIIMPDELIDSYHLLDNAYKVIGFGSTMGIEATYWDKISIMAGHSMYETLNVVYRPDTHNQLLDLLLDDTLTPKNKLGTYIFGYYYAASGIPFTYYKPVSYKEGVFKDVDLKEFRLGNIYRGIKYILYKLGFNKVGVLKKILFIHYKIKFR